MLTALVSIAEGIVGTIIIVKSHSRLGYHLALVVFSLLIVIALYQSVIGQANCGCLGRAIIAPHTMVTIDAALLIGLLWIRKINDSSTGKLRSRKFAGSLAAYLLIWIGAVAFSQFEVNTGKGVIKRFDYVYLQPSEWQGGEIQQIEEILGIEIPIANGQIAIVRGGCPKCKNYLIELDREIASGNAEEFFVIVLPPIDDMRAFSNRISCDIEFIDSDKVWVLDVPIEVSINGGVVNAIKTDP